MIHATISFVMHGFSFHVTKKDTRTYARSGVLSTPHGSIRTPAFVPVGTQASVKSLDSADIQALGIDMFFVNTYHMYLRPGIDVIKRVGGLHAFMGWQGPIITDSGGFQAFSLSDEVFRTYQIEWRYRDTDPITRHGRRY